MIINEYRQDGLMGLQATMRHIYLSIAMTYNYTSS